jgi:hypothetical protein
LMLYSPRCFDITLSEQHFHSESHLPVRIANTQLHIADDHMKSLKICCAAGQVRSGGNGPDRRDQEGLDQYFALRL